ASSTANSTNFVPLCLCEKSVEHIHPSHQKQVLTYLKLTGLKLGYLLNFGAPVMKDGIWRIINGKLD
ncbi:MAG: GxxExxY protein, partial [Chloroflexus sp.]|uniref:GxxExxY protein n=1 Tax=Chloroflexus sp. TaxID=1904827 RepID=UPI00404B7E4C